MCWLALPDGALGQRRCVDLHRAVAVVVAVDGSQIGWRMRKIYTPEEAINSAAQRAVAVVIAAHWPELADGGARLAQRCCHRDEVSRGLPAQLSEALRCQQAPL